MSNGHMPQFSAQPPMQGEVQDQDQSPFAPQNGAQPITAGRYPPVKVT